MSLPTPYTVQLESWTGGGFDSHGNPVDTWAPPVGVPVHGWATPGSDTETAAGYRTAVERDLDVYAPAGTVVGPRDRMTVDGLRYEVVGYVEDYTHGPWQWPAGVRINLRRVEG